MEQQNLSSRHSLTTLANAVCETAKAQATMATIMAAHLPSLNDREKQTLVDAGKKMNMQVLNLQ